MYGRPLDDLNAIFGDTGRWQGSRKLTNAGRIWKAILEPVGFTLKYEVFDGCC